MPLLLSLTLLLSPADAASCGELMRDWLAAQELRSEAVPSTCVRLQKTLWQLEGAPSAVADGQVGEAAEVLADLEREAAVRGGDARAESLRVERAAAWWEHARQWAAIHAYGDAVRTAARARALDAALFTDDDRRQELARWTFQAGYAARHGRPGDLVEARRLYRQGLSLAEPGTEVHAVLTRQLQQLDRQR